MTSTPSFPTPPLTRKASPFSRSRSAFSLAELLTVICIMSIMAGVSGVALSSVAQSSITNRNLASIGDSLGAARRYAITHRSYTALVFGEARDSSGASNLVVVTATSGDGSNHFGADPLNLSTTDFQLVTPVQQLKGIQLSSVQDASDGIQKQNATVQFAGKTFTLTNMVLFTPAGTIYSGANSGIMVQMKLEQVRGTKTTAAATIKIDRFSGFTEFICDVSM